MQDIAGLAGAGCAGAIGRGIAKNAVADADVLLGIKAPLGQQSLALGRFKRLFCAVDPAGAQNDPFYGAPTAVLVLGEKNNPNGVQDASLVMGNLLLAASGIGLGSCWINRAKETFETPEGKALLAIAVAAQVPAVVTASSSSAVICSGL